MSASNSRVKGFCTYHHLMSRIAHKVYFMTDEVRTDFIEMLRRASDFCGIQLVSWCVLSNHFHVLAYLPEPQPLDEAEVVRRYGVLKGAARKARLERKLASLRLATDGGEGSVALLLARIQKPMYKIGEFMKIVKQWLTQEYNQRYAHTGTLWESVYKDVPVPDAPSELGKRAAYIHLNPIRAAVATEFDEYAWSSLAALRKGDDLALRGMRRIYGEDASETEILGAHKELMAELLEQIKFDRAVDVARRRAAGFEAVTDSLTNEALVAQAAAHLQRVMTAAVEEHTIRRMRGRPRKNDGELAERIRQLLAENPKLTGAAVAEAVGRPVSTVYLYLRRIRKEVQ